MATVNGTEINLQPSEAMQAEARLYRAWKAEGQQGGTEVAATRAGQILSGDELSPDTVITMAAWFARHEVDKTGGGFSPGEDGYPSPGRVAWAAWGGDPGQSWADARAARIKAAEETDRSRIANLTLTESQSMEVRELNKEPLKRNAVVADWRQADNDPDVVEFSFSSEEPVERFFGQEVLSHAPGAINMARLNTGAAPWLWNHKPDVVLGVVERAWQGPDGRGYARNRWSPNTKAEGSEEWKVRQNWEAGIIRNVSFLYSIDAPIDTRSREGVALVTAFTPMEISTVSIPADSTVGNGRAIGHPAAPAATPTPPQSTTMESVDLTQERAAAAADAVTAERSRIAAITTLTREHGADDLAGDLIASGASEADAMRSVLATIGKRAKQPATPSTPAAQPIGSNGADIGLSEKEARSYSFLRAIRAQAYPQDAAMQREAAFEREVSEATAARMGADRDGFHVPHDVLRRDLTIGTASAAGDLVFTDARPGSFIELLRNRLALTALGVTPLTGLVGPVAIPKKLSGATAYWVGEKGEPSESNPTVGQVNLTGKTLGAFTEFSRKFLLQSSIAAETFVRNELVATMALEIDRAGLYGLGSVSQPQGLKLVTGINTVDFAANAPTYAEIVEMESAINADNADIAAMAYLTNSTRFGGFKTTEKASGTAQFILEPGGTVNGYPVVRSNQVESNDVWFGVWSQMIMGMWGAITLQANPYALDKSGGVRVTAFQDVDVAVRYPEAFTRGNNTL